MIPTSVLPIRSVLMLTMAIAVAAFIFVMATQETEAGAEDAFSIDPASSDIGVGGSGSVDLVSTPGAESLAVWIVEVSFDPDIVSFDSCTSLDNPAGAVAASDCAAKDTGGSPDDDTVVSVGGVIFTASEMGLEDETTLASMSFDAVGDAGECSDLTITVISHLGPDPEGDPGEADVTDGEVCIVENPFLYGDTNCDDDVNIGDAISIARDQVNLPVNSNGCPDVEANVEVDGVNRLWPDTNCDDDINIGDAISIARDQVNLPVNSNGCPELETVVNVVQ